MKMFRAQNKTIITHYAGTSPNGLILRSVNGVDWQSLGSKGKGNPLAFCQLSNGDLLYTTDEGWVVNHTQNTSVKVSDYAIRAICATFTETYYGEMAVLGDYYGDSYVTVDGVTWSQYSGQGNRINTILQNGDFISLLFTINGIYTGYNHELIQPGNFTSTYFDRANGFIYAGTSNGHVFKNAVANVFTGVGAWSDLGLKTNGAHSIVDIIKANTGTYSPYDEYYFSADDQRIYLTHDDFATVNYTVAQSYLINKFLHLGDAEMITGGNNGHLYYYSNWPNFGTVDDLGQQLSQTLINCLIKTQ